MGVAEGAGREDHAKAANAKGTRQRAVGTRGQVITYLASATDVSDQGGMASTRLAEAVGYPGSSVAFAQLLSSMERDGLLIREVRGKRTYRIALAPGVTPGTVRSGSQPKDHPGLASAPEAAQPVAAVRELQVPAPSPELDYDELARRLLIQVTRQVAAAADPAAEVAVLERELAVARRREAALLAENRQLREQLAHASSSVNQARRVLAGAGLDLPAVPAPAPGSPADGNLTEAEVVMLERLAIASREAASDLGEQAGAQPGATAM